MTSSLSARRGLRLSSARLALALALLSLGVPALPGCGNDSGPPVKRVLGAWSGMGGGDTTWDFTLAEAAEKVTASGTLTNVSGGVTKTFTLTGTGTWDDPRLTMSWRATSGASSVFYTYVGALSADGSRLAGDNTEVMGKTTESLAFTRKP